MYTIYLYDIHYWYNAVNIRIRRSCHASPLIFRVRRRWLSSDGLKGGGGHAIKYS